MTLLTALGFGLAGLLVGWTILLIADWWLKAERGRAPFFLALVFTVIASALSAFSWEACA